MRKKASFDFGYIDSLTKIPLTNAKIQGIKIPFYVTWRMNTDDEQQSKNSGYQLVGDAQNGDIIWYPQTMAPKDRNWEQEGMVKVLEQALAGCPTAYRALRDIVLTNLKYKDYENVLNTLSETYEND